MLSSGAFHRTVSPVVCFVKQKTAYEMRISDWSSDVCSSDLGGVFPGHDAEDDAAFPVTNERDHRIRIAIGKHFPDKRLQLVNGLRFQPHQFDGVYALIEQMAQLSRERRAFAMIEGSDAVAARPQVAGLHRALPPQIGSAPGRERGWQYGVD